MYLHSLKLLWSMVKEMHYQKIHYLTLTQRSRGSRSHKMLPSTLDFMWPMHQQNLMLLHPMVKEKMHLQEKTLFDLDLGVMVTQNLPSTLDIMWPMHQHSLILLHLTVREDAFTRKCIIWHWPSGQGHMTCCLVPSTSCDLLSNKTCSCYVERF